MHIEIEFTGDIVTVAEQYMATLEVVKNWLKTNEIRSEIGWNDGKMILKLADLDSYILWLGTYSDRYTIVRD